MNLTTKFDLGQEVLAISQEHKTVFVPCEHCAGVGEVIVDGATYSCQKCYGQKGNDKSVGMPWAIKFEGRVGQVRAKIEYPADPDDSLDNMERDETKTESQNEYMLLESGIGSGTIWYEDRLFASRPEAEAECDKRNSELESPTNT